MIQPLMPLENIGSRRVGSHAGGKQQKYVLSDHGRRLILEHYDGTTEKITWLSKQLAVPRHVVKKWGGQLGLARQKEPRWTPQDEAFLERNLHHMSLTTIAQQLGRTKTAVKLKAKRLHINKCGQEGYTMQGLCLGLGCDHKQVEKWMKNGWLKGQRRQTERTPQQGGDVWYFSDKAIRAFIKGHPQEIDPRRADWLWLVDILVGGLGALE